MSRQHHELKTETEYYQQVENGSKKFELIVSLTLAKLDIQKLKYDHYLWSMLGYEGQVQIEQTLTEIHQYLDELKTE